MSVSSPIRMAALYFHVESVVVLRPNYLHLLDKNVEEKELHTLALSITCHKQHAAFNIQNKTSLSHSRSPFDKSHPTAARSIESS